MIEAFYILSLGGVVIWSKVTKPLVGNPVNELIGEAILESRAGEQFRNGTYSIEWKKDNANRLVFVAVARQVLNVSYLGKLVDKVHSKFVPVFESADKQIAPVYDEFDALFEASVKSAENHKPQRQMRTFQQSAAGKKGTKKKKETAAADQKPAKNVERTTQQQPKKMMARGKGGKARKKKLTKSPSKPQTKSKPHWNSSKVDKKVAMKKLDRTGLEGERVDAEIDADTRDEMMGEGFNFDDEYESTEEEEEDDEKAPVQRGFFGNLVRGLTGRDLDESDLQPVISALREHIIAKNVASEMAGQLSESVYLELMGHHVGGLSSVTSVAKKALEAALVKILTPKRQVDILREISVAKEKGNVYSIVFIGINGVGKSTNLSKVCAWLQQNGINVMIAACDTFRSGAVEQLKVHANCLKVPLFEQGYGADAARIAQNAIAHAGTQGYDVVLVDTAGRMQDNEPLMKSLGKLVSVNRPDLVLFVGEALAGNDSVDQLTRFNQALIDYGDQKPRQVDGIILTKFDTIDDKVGAAISLSYSSSLPIIFLGTGQHYTDLKRMNPRAVARSLLK